MKYTLINEHSNVDLHDAYVNSVYFQENNMIWELAALQARNIVQELCGNNCYIKNAVMVLENAHIGNIVIGGYKSYENGILIDSRESVSASPNEYDNLLKSISYRNYSYIYGIKDLIPDDEKRYKISVMTIYEITITFTKSLIKWDEFGGEGWRRSKVWTSEHPN